MTNENIYCFASLITCQRRETSFHVLQQLLEMRRKQNIAMLF